MNYILTWQGAGLPKQYFCHTGDFTPAKELAQKFNAEEAIDKHDDISSVLGVHRVVRIEHHASNMAEQVSPGVRRAVAVLVGGDPKSEQFESILRATPALPEGWKATDAARAYAATLFRKLTNQ